MNYASAGVGSVSHLNFEVFKDAVGMEAIHIPYKGGGQAIADIVAGHVPMTITSVQGTKAWSSPASSRPCGHQPDALARHAARSDHAGSRVKKTADVELRFWFGIFGPKGLPDAVKAKLEGVFSTVMADQTPARAAGQSRHHTGLLARPRVASAARKRNQELDEIRRREGHQAGIARRDTHPVPELLNHVQLDLGDAPATIPSDLAAACETSITRPLTNGPRSLTRTVTDRPLSTSVTRTFVPNGSVG